MMQATCHCYSYVAGIRAAHFRDARRRNVSHAAVAVHPPPVFTAEWLCNVCGLSAHEGGRRSGPHTQASTPEHGTPGPPPPCLVAGEPADCPGQRRAPRKACPKTSQALTEAEALNGHAAILPLICNPCGAMHGWQPGAPVGMASTRCTQPTLRIAGDASGVTHGFCLIVFSLILYSLTSTWHPATAYLTEPHRVASSGLAFGGKPHASAGHRAE